MESSIVEAAISAFLDDPPLSDNETAFTQKLIVKQVKSNVPNCKKKQIKKCLKKLQKQGTIVRVQVPGKDKVYSVVRNHSNSSNSKRKHENDTLPSATEAVPIAELLRKRRGQGKVQKKTEPLVASEKDGSKGDDVVDIDEEIRRLEAELNADDDDDDDGDSEESDHDNDGEISMNKYRADNSTNQIEPQQPAVICLSTLAKDRIAALPPSCLPTNKRRVLKIDKDPSTSITESAKRRRKQDDTKNSTISDGLKAAVQQVLEGYVPRSNEKLPFYCRVCARQYADESEFVSHKSTEFHKAAVELERKASYCKLCRKQLTSPVQLKEHVLSKPHRDRLQLLKSRQQPRNKK